MWAGIDAEAEYAAAHRSRRARALRVHDRVRPPLRVPARPLRARRGRGASGNASSACGSSHRAARWTSASPRAASAGRVRRGRRQRALRHRAPRGELHEPGPGARVQIAVAPCSPFSVTRRLMADSADLARRLGLPLHTHLAETREENAYCRELYGCTPVEDLADLGWLAADVWCAHCVHLSDTGHRELRAERHRRRALPDVEPPARRRSRASSRARRRGRPRRPRRRRLGVERAQRPPVR